MVNEIAITSNFLELEIQLMFEETALLTYISRGGGGCKR